MLADLAISSIFWSISSVNYCTCYFEMWPNICKYSNVPHGGPERPPVTNSSGVLTNKTSGIELYHSYRLFNYSNFSIPPLMRYL